MEGKKLKRGKRSYGVGIGIFIFNYQPFLKPYKISMVNHTFYKYSLFLLYKIHTLLFYILNKNLSLYNYHINEFE
ncbi:hypothetical protein BpHYR1_009647 [Brachionus plicatilis]|uniref:Uncharacterized protein n=1 Tax=Brachionus plicatilis TaxID=10195 RepID=A0A3M7S9G4_BRAPC|nr:hypothetical protein BpHYR1_009647 [Brachionus plicatilis]